MLVQLRCCEEAQLTWIGQGFQPGRDIHTVAIDIVPVNENLAQIDADAEKKTLILSEFGAQRADGILDADGTVGRCHDALEACQDGVSGVVHDLSTRVPDSIGDQVETGGQLPMGAKFVRLAQSAVSGYVGIDDGRELVGNILIGHELHTVSF